MTRSRAAKESHVGMDMYDAEVVRTRQLSPHVRRITFGAERLRTFQDDGPDQRFKLMLPRSGQDKPVLPSAGRWYEEWLAMPHAVRPIMRTYTIRAARPECGEVDVDMLVHADGGPGSTFARSAQPGDRAGIQGAWAEYELPAHAPVQLLAGDLSALPALAAISEQRHHDESRQLLIELEDLADVAAFDGPAGTPVQWVLGDPDRPGGELLQAIRALSPLPAQTYAWIAGEQSMVADLRRHMVRERGLKPANVMFMGYWRRGGAIDPD